MVYYAIFGQYFVVICELVLSIICLLLTFFCLGKDLPCKIIASFAYNRSNKIGVVLLKKPSNKIEGVLLKKATNKIEGELLKKASSKIEGVLLNKAMI